MPLSRFLQQSIESVEKWSKQYDSNDKIFIESPTIGLKQWTDGLILNGQYFYLFGQYFYNRMVSFFIINWSV